MIVELRERAVVGREHHHLVGLDDRVEVRERPHLPAGTVGLATAGACDIALMSCGLTMSSAAIGTEPAG